VQEEIYHTENDKRYSSVEISHAGKKRAEKGQCGRTKRNGHAGIFRKIHNAQKQDYSGTGKSDEREQKSGKTPDADTGGIAAQHKA